MTDKVDVDRLYPELPELQPRDRLTAELQSIGKFFDHHHELREPHITMHVTVESRAELDALAGLFGKEPPRATTEYAGAQFYVETSAGVRVIIAWVDRSAR